VEPALLGREGELETIGRLLETARLGVSGTLAILGEPGVGKTALLDSSVSGLGDMRLLRATGLETEQHIPFAGLLQLLRPAMGHLDGLAPPQAAALSGALAVSDATQHVVDRFAIGAAVLSLLSRYAEEAPVAVVVEDLHALDLPSVEAILFAVRRLAADPVAVLLTARSPEADHLVAGLPQLRLAGLDDDAAASLAERAAGEAIPTGRLEPLIARAGGNPLALLELAGDDLDTLATDHAELPTRVPDAVTAAYGRRLDQLDDACRTALLVAAVCGGDLAVTTQACASLEVAVDRLADAEDAGLVSVRAGQVTFRHPLVRSAAYSRAGASERRAAHAAVAAALPPADIDRRAWHLAEAVWMPDPAVAELLSEAAERSWARTAYSVASGAFERSARLSPEPDLRAERLLRAADAAWAAGLTERAVALLDAHGREDPATAGQIRALALRGGIAACTGRLRDAREMLIGAADLSEDPAEECVLLADAMQASFFQAGVSDATELAVRLAARVAAVTDPKAQALALIATGIGKILAGRPGGVDDLREAVPLIQETPDLPTDPRWTPFVTMVPLFLRDTTEGGTLWGFVDEVRERAGVGALPPLLFQIARDQATTSSWAEAEANYSEALRLAQETGQVTYQVMAQAGLCWLQSRRGEEVECRRWAEQVLAAPEIGHLPLAEAWVRFAVADLELSLGEPARAVEQVRLLEALLERHEIADVDLVPGPELVEALVRLGEASSAETAAAAYRAAAEAKRQPWALARAARARGLVADDSVAQECFEFALHLHAETLDRFEAGRTHLAYGEWLRRTARRVDARVELRAALDDFEYLGASRWAERAATELAASGETVQRRGADPRSLLTPQELQVSLQLTEGRTTREAAAALFLSPKTVEYHLRKVYTKLDIGSRAELAEVLRG
jgi:DNA-binding CsgD family transcriptional regulator